MRGALLAIIRAHPSGDPAPSAADVQVTRQLRDAAKAVDIDLLDHKLWEYPAPIRRAEVTCPFGKPESCEVPHEYVHGREPLAQVL